MAMRNPKRKRGTTLGSMKVYPWPTDPSLTLQVSHWINGIDAKIDYEKLVVYFC